ncbi:MarR family transcriptional regulator [Bacillus pumilus]|uniref:MarR family winged helix-turn-helix transcriptional regulator n=1 Tax=Bacillus TaxID=1386 RepID=UPI000D02B0FA|nr:MULTISPECIES: MarR family transcriptional regulator [Bacillus]MBU5257974.1 MarR family transcriptional regulator [Bacillus pumilus]MDF2003072.1 MarR family transcriptional regulator [Bacillus pumilus]MDF2023997.1 MarR family transcriptional regulator [Bacillus pumilus]MDF2027954.1 MarR family transcriptional regulator [Bacillus pumilus]MDF2088883.1 MarR family transcriptional regulator [Bacillus pumilus]
MLLDEEIIHYGKKIIEYSNALGSIYVEEYQRFLKHEYADLSAKQELTLELLRTKTRTINELADYFSISASAASQLVSKLEQLGYVKREINPHNRREIIVDFAQKGHDYHKNTEEIQLHLIQKYYARLPKEDLKTLLSLYEKIYQIAKEAP